MTYHEKNDYKLRKVHLDLRFLLECIKNNLIPKSLQFKLANRHLHNSVVYKKCQIKLLEEKIRAKRKIVNISRKDKKTIKEELQGTLSFLDFSYICSLFLVANDEEILHHDNIHKRKLKSFLEISLKEVINDSHDHNKVIFNFSSFELRDVEKSVLRKGLKFSVKPKSIEYSKFLLRFEFLFRDVKQENLCSENLSLMKARLLGTALSSNESFSNVQSPSENLTASEFKALRHLSKNKNIVIQKADKGNATVILDKISYISAIEEILNDHTKFSNLDIPAGKEISFTTNLEKRITSDLKLLKDKEIIDKATYKNIKPVGSKPGILYGLGKVHKETKNGLPPLHPILSAIGMPTQKSSKFLLPFLTLLTQNEYTVTDSFHFAEEICKQDPNLYMASQDVDSLFTNIPLDEAIDICIYYLYKDDEHSPKISRDIFRNFLTVATKESFFMYNNKFHNQIDGVAMESTLGPALANILCAVLKINGSKTVLIV